MSLQAYFIFIFFFPTSQQYSCRDPSTIEYNVCALKVPLQLQITGDGNLEFAEGILSGHKSLRPTCELFKYYTELV